MLCQSCIDLYNLFYSTNNSTTILPGISNLPSHISVEHKNYEIRNVMSRLHWPIQFVFILLII